MLSCSSCKNHQGGCVNTQPHSPERPLPGTDVWLEATSSTAETSAFPPREETRRGSPLLAAGEGALEVDTDAPAPASSYLDPDCAPGLRGGVQEDLQVPPEDGQGDHVGAVPTVEGAAAVGDKRTVSGSVEGMGGER